MIAKHTFREASYKMCRVTNYLFWSEKWKQILPFQKESEHILKVSHDIILMYTFSERWSVHKYIRMHGSISMSIDVKFSANFKLFL